MISAVQKSYIGGYPPHFADPSSSCIKIIDFAEFDKLKPEEMQCIFKKQHIVVTNYPTSPRKLDKKAMAYLANSSRPITIHGELSVYLLYMHILTKSDMSVLPKAHDADGRHVIGVTGDLIKSHRSPNGKILHVLDFPMPTRGRCAPETIATDILAFNKTLDDPQCKMKIPFPVSVYWALAGTEGSIHYFHIDLDGFGTYIDPQTGAKYWLFA
jgi:hypothetical protein